MSAVQKLESTSKTYSVSANQGYVSGRLGSRQTMQLKEGKRWMQLLTTPAPDPYSMPSVVELKSRDPLGQDGEDWSGFVRIGGYPNNYEITDSKTGEIRQVRSARMVLEVVDQ